LVQMASTWTGEVEGGEGGRGYALACGMIRVFAGGILWRDGFASAKRGTKIVTMD